MTGELVPDRRNGDWWEPGLTVQQLGGGGVSDSEPPDVDLRRPQDGGVPMANCTAGGEIDRISQLLPRFSDRFILIGSDRAGEISVADHSRRLLLLLPMVISIAIIDE
uniref:Uncharacterized protein n=1 Tax=Anopheles coluzzii TaxID=1518534 RepID=A0A8W7PVT0_ANOCL